MLTLKICSTHHELTCCFTSSSFPTPTDRRFKGGGNNTMVGTVVKEKVSELEENVR